MARRRAPSSLCAESDDVARLRLLHVEILRAAMALAAGWWTRSSLLRGAPVTAMLKLWTNDVLVSARRIYEATGFQLVSEEKHHSFGKDLVGQIWELKL